MKTNEAHELAELDAAIARMPDAVRVVFMLRKRDGLEQDEIARHLGIAPADVDELLERAAIEFANALTLARLNVFQRALHRIGLLDLAEHRARAELDLSQVHRE